MELFEPRAESVLPRDHRQRQRIVEQLDTNMLVEAAAGTGKTSSIVSRMVALIRDGLCTIETMAAVTFTRKAAAELRERFRTELQAAANSTGGAAGQKLVLASGRMERCFIGTIHAFCARLLRERPIEAGVDLAFQEMEPEEDTRLRKLAWEEYISSLFVREDTVLIELGELGLQIGQLSDAFLTFADYPDVQEWPAPPVEMGDLNPVRQALASYVGHMRDLATTFPMDRGNDRLMGEYERIVRMSRHRDYRHRDAELMQILERFNPKLAVIQRNWPQGAEQGKREQEQWIAFATSTVQPVLDRWRARRYAVVMRVLRDAVEIYDGLRVERGRLNYQDVLIQSARLLRDHPQVRRYFRKRYGHLLVDEFQDTDPVQAEVMMLMTAKDTAERDWRRCTPAPGSLFVVGDPKQSIYRFRRADIVTYNQVRRIIIDSGGVLVPLSTNFRTRSEIVDWGNAVFDQTFPAAPDQYSPAARPIDVGRTAGTEGEIAGICTLDIPAENSNNNDDAVEYESSLIARWVRHCLDSKRTIPRSAKEVEQGVVPHARPSDFMIVTRVKKHLEIYAHKLYDLGIPAQVSGGSAWRQVVQLRLMADCLRALSDPDNPVALVAVLRSELFGFSDVDLYAYRNARGTLSFREDVPECLAEDAAQRFRNAFMKMRRYWRWTRQLPLVSAVERIASDLGLAAWALTEPGGDVQAGTIAKLFELLRAARGDLHGLSDVVTYLSELIEQEAEFDGIPVQASRGGVVRVMNLHRAKGLEAPVVFLADPTGKIYPPVQLHIDRVGEKVCGYLAVSEKTGRFYSSMLACPCDWSKYKDEEQRFIDAESNRLSYVAATRSGVQLIITQRANGNGYSHWQFFEPHLKNYPALSDPGPQTLSCAEPVEMSAQDIDTAGAQVAARWSAVVGPTYAVEAAKRITVKTPSTHFGADGGEHGTEWGTLLHVLLEAAMRHPDADPEKLAYTVLRDLELDTSLLQDAIETVKSVLESPILQRAGAGSQRLAEVPFEMWREPAAPETGLPTLVRGVIDLAFLESTGWVIVDYKTDAVAPKAVPQLVEHYRDQVRLYREAWQSITGETVKEAGLYFTRVDEYVPV